MFGAVGLSAHRRQIIGIPNTQNPMFQLAKSAAWPVADREPDKHSDFMPN